MFPCVALLVPDGWVSWRISLDPRVSTLLNPSSFQTFADDRSPELWTEIAALHGVLDCLSDSVAVTS